MQYVDIFNPFLYFDVPAADTIKMHLQKLSNYSTADDF